MKEVDPTGAGDVFAAAFLVRSARRRRTLSRRRASPLPPPRWLCEATALGAIAGRAEIEALLSAGQVKVA